MTYKKDYLISFIFVVVGIILLSLVSCTKTITVEKVVEKEVPVTVVADPVKYVIIEVVDINDSVKTLPVITIP